MIAALETLEVDPIKVDPRPCGYCGLTIERHRRVDAGEGPEFFCLPPDELNLDELQLRADLTRQIEVAAIVRDMEMNDPRDRWRHTGELPPSVPVEKINMPRPYRTPRATVDAFRYMVSLEDPQRLADWLRDHPKDAAFLIEGIA